MGGIAVNLIKFYQRFISPGLNLVFFNQFWGCRFYPSCSGYSIEAIEKHGALRGGLKSILRILRCGPWSRGGLDLS